MDKMREEFEAWARLLPLANLNRHLDGYENQTINSHWSTWQASRQALVVELPFGECDTTAQDIDVLKCRLESAGIKWTE